jgi:hypothetical protein
MSENVIKPTNPKTKPFDVSRPGQTPPPSSARPVIVTNQPEQADPMIHETAPEKDLDLKKDLSSPGKEIDHFDKHRGTTASVEKEAAVLDKRSPHIDSSLVTVSSETTTKKLTWKIAAVLAVIIVVLIGAVYYYR